MAGLILKNCATNDIRLSVVDPHDMIQRIVVLLNLCVQIDHYHYNISTRCLIVDSRVDSKNHPFRY